MNNDKIVFGSVIYRNALPYLNEFLESIYLQSTDEFDLLLLNDDVLGEELELFDNILNSPRVILINSTRGKKPFELRVQLILEAKKLNYDLLILGDCDDKFDVNRVANVVNCYKKYSEFSFYYNDLLTFGQMKAIGDLPDETRSIQSILEYNYLGLSNTSLNLRKFELDWLTSLYEGDTFVFDWYMHSRILLMGGVGKFVEQAYTFYRIYDENFAGINCNHDENLKKEYNIKLKHYELLSQRSEWHKELYEKYKSLDINNYHTKSYNTYWWSNINLLK